MFRAVLSIAFLSALLVTASNALSDEAAEVQTSPDSLISAGDSAEAVSCQKSSQCTACTGSESSSKTCSGDKCSGDKCSGDKCSGDKCSGKTCTAETLTSKTSKTCAAGECSSKLCSAEANTSQECPNKTCGGDACESKSCEDIVKASGACGTTVVRLIQVGAKIESDSSPSCSASACCESNESSQTCVAGESIGKVEACNGGSACPFSLASSATVSSCCGCGSACACGANAEQDSRQHVAILHQRFIEEATKCAVMAAKLQFQEEMAKAQATFAKLMLEKEIEAIHLQAQLEVSSERQEMTEDFSEALVEFERAKVSLEIACERNEQLKTELARSKSSQAEALADSKADNARLSERIADLEKRLDSIPVEIANQPSEAQLK